ncbi:MAG TPA: hypothetical protein VL098_03350 [Flavipsychrobacter sp.]|nr:hypothetical protein [Flavipsychrobacter sp.]
MKNILIILGIGITIFFAGCSKTQNADALAPNGSGQGGSLARFTIAHNHLYVVDEQKLYTYSLANPEKPVLHNVTTVGINVETIYPFKDMLFIGSQDAMYVYSLEDPSKPDHQGTASHVRACDPVVADGDVAYVTVRSGSTCGGTLNALLVYDIKNINSPYEVSRRELNNPWGLGVKGNRLYVCDGNAGLNIFDITDQQSPVLIKKISGETFYDVIVTNNLLIAMIDGGTALYEFGEGDALVQVAKITN